MPFHGVQELGKLLQTQVIPRSIILEWLRLLTIGTFGEGTFLKRSKTTICERCFEFHCRLQASFCVEETVLQERLTTEKWCRV